MDGVLNEATDTVHRQEPSKQEICTECGVSYSVPEDHLCRVRIEQEVTASATSKCGRCFEDGGGY